MDNVSTAEEITHKIIKITVKFSIIALIFLSILTLYLALLKSAGLQAERARTDQLLKGPMGAYVLPSDQCSVDYETCSLDRVMPFLGKEFNVRQQEWPILFGISLVALMGVLKLLSKFMRSARTHTEMKLLAVAHITAYAVFAMSVATTYIANMMLIIAIASSYGLLSIIKHPNNVRWALRCIALLLFIVLVFIPIVTLSLPPAYGAEIPISTVVMRVAIVCLIISVTFFLPILLALHILKISSAHRWILFYFAMITTTLALSTLDPVKLTGLRENQNFILYATVCVATVVGIVGYFIKCSRIAGREMS